MSPSTTAPIAAPTQPLRVALALLAVDRRVADIEHRVTSAVLSMLPAPLLAGPRGAKVLERLQAYAAAQGVAAWLAEEGWPRPEDRTWAQRRVKRVARRLGHALTRALIGYIEACTSSVGESADDGGEGSVGIQELLIDTSKQDRGPEAPAKQSLIVT